MLTGPLIWDLEGSQRGSYRTHSRNSASNKTDTLKFDTKLALLNGKELIFSCKGRPRANRFQKEPNFSQVQTDTSSKPWHFSTQVT